MFYEVTVFNFEFFELFTCAVKVSKISELFSDAATVFPQN